MEPCSTADQRIRSTWQARAAAGEPFAVVRVRNLQATVYAAQDAWGRDGKPQPLLVSAEISLRDPFGDSSVSDKVAGDTVHYGILSKAILASLERYQKPPPNQDDGRSGTTLRDVLETIWSGLTGLAINGTGPGSFGENAKAALLDISRISTMAITVTLPKGSLLGSGVSLTATSVFDTHVGTNGDKQSRTDVFGICLGIHDLRIPTLIGVNSNERLAKQIVAVNIEMDKFNYAPDAYAALEALVVKTVDATSFETLEALGAYLIDKIATDFRPQPEQTYSGPSGWQIKVCMEKPTAVPFAEAPCVEIRGGSK